MVVQVFLFDMFFCLSPFNIGLSLSGVGKSKLIEAMSCWAEKIFTKSGDNPNNPRVIIAAATGKAASIVGKFIYFD